MYSPTSTILHLDLTRCMDHLMKITRKHFIFYQVLKLVCEHLKDGTDVTKHVGVVEDQCACARINIVTKRCSIKRVSKN